MDTSITSSRIAYILAKSLVPTLALVLLYAALAHLNGNTLTPALNEQLSPTFLRLLIGVALASGFLLLVFAARFSWIECDDKGLSVIRHGKRSAFSWNEIKSVKQSIGLSPPVYQISFRDGRAPAYVSMTCWKFLSIIVWSWDFTDFKTYAKSQIEISRKQAVS